MKAIKYLFATALLVGFTTAAQAQDGSKNDVNAVKQIISSKPADIDKQLKPFYKANKKTLRIWLPSDVSSLLSRTLLMQENTPIMLYRPARTSVHLPFCF